jgi:PAS domain S-box-containing protein
MTAPGPPNADEVAAFLDSLRQHRERLLMLARDAGGRDDDGFQSAIDAVGEALLVADEELRVQHEHLRESARRLDLLVAAHEELFDSAPAAYLQTDADGMIVRYNRAAARLLGLRASAASPRAFVSLVSPADRSALRALVSKLRATAAGVPFAGPPPLLEATAVTADGAVLPVVISGRRSSGGAAQDALLHWEIQHRNAASPPPPRQGDAVERADHVLALAEAAADLARQDSPILTIEHAAQQARTAVPACDEASVMIVRSRNRVDTPAATGRMAAACDHLQERLGEGPCLGAIDDSRPIRVRDMTIERRWPRFAPPAAELGVRSMLAVPLATPRGVAGALNLYARRPDAFDDDDELIAAALATHAGIAVAHAELEANLRIGLRTREEIGRAVGILMERHRVTASAAFDMLVLASQHSHRKLRDVAAWMTETGEDPARLITPKRADPTSRSAP